MTTFDPFTAADPPVIVHEIDPSDFEKAWHGPANGEENLVCPVCGRGTERDRGVSPHTSRPWVRYSCNDFVAQETTAG
jgi:hypothetical protein